MVNWVQDSFIGERGEFTRLNANHIQQIRNVVKMGDDMYTCESRIITNEEYDQIVEQRRYVEEILGIKQKAEEYEDAVNAVNILMGGTT